MSYQGRCLCGWIRYEMHGDLFIIREERLMGVFSRSTITCGL